ncbi:MAG: MFS transporter [Candidatus Binatia bacterium]|nr:MFS transporter [Candidatus Binatia bacterium]
MTRTERTFYILEGSFQTWGWFMTPVYPIFLLSKGLDLFQMNVVLATYFLATAIFEVPTGAVADVFGRRFSFILSCFVRSGAFLLYTFADSFTDCLIAEVIDAIGYTLASGALEAWAIDGIREEGDHRPTDRLFARVEMIIRGVMIVGGIAGGLLADIDLLLPWYVATVGFSLTGLYALVAMKEPRRPKRTRSAPIFQPLVAQMRDGVAAARASRTVGILCLISAFTAAALLPVNLTWPPRLELLSDQGYWVLGAATALLNAAAFTGAALTTRLLRHTGREYLLFGTTLVRGLVFAAAALATQFYPVLLGLLIGELMGGAGRPAYQAWLNEHIESSRRATVLSVATMSFTLGAAIGLVALGLLARSSGFSSAWLVAAALLVIAAPGYLLLGRIAPPVVGDEASTAG